MVESDTQKLLKRHVRRTGRPSKRLLETIAIAQQEILFVVTNGHRMPRRRAFDFDDDGKPTVSS